MRSFIILLAFFSTLIFAKAQSVLDNAAVKLFNGQNLEGWHVYGKTDAGNSWRVDKENNIYLDASVANRQRGDLVTNEEFENFDLKLEWKISRNGNSGIIFLVHEDTARYPATYNTGLEMQVLDNDGHSDGKIHKHRAGDLYDLIACSKETVKPVWEWNAVEIICNKGNLQLYLNGILVVETMLWNKEWKDLVAGSKFKNMPGFAIYPKGRIALQDHGNEVWFRNIVIKKF